MLGVALWKDLILFQKEWIGLRQSEALVALKWSYWETYRQNWHHLPSYLCHSSWLCGGACTKPLTSMFLPQGISSIIS